MSPHPHPCTDFFCRSESWMCVRCWHLKACYLLRHDMMNDAVLSRCAVLAFTTKTKTVKGAWLTRFTISFWFVMHHFGVSLCVFVCAFAYSTSWAFTATPLQSPTTVTSSPTRIYGHSWVLPAGFLSVTLVTITIPFRMHRLKLKLHW